MKSEERKVKSFGNFFHSAQKVFLFKMKISERSEEIHITFYLFPFTFHLYSFTGGSFLRHSL